MPMHNLDEYCIVMPGIAPASTNVSQYSASIDTKGYQQALVIVNAGVATSSAEIDACIREGLYTLSLTSQMQVTTYHTNVTSATFTQITAANDIKTYVGWLNLARRSRFISLVFKRDGTNEAVAAGNVILFRKHIAPTTQVNTIAFHI